jgi:outer membrane receptor protein involved in Fe transport
MIRHISRMAALGWLFGFASMQAQTPSAGVVGRVLDPHGSNVSAAAVVLRSVQTSEIRKTSSDEKGEFTIPNLAPGPYEIMLSKEGFHAVRQTDLVLEVEQIARLEFRLELGAVSQSVLVTASAPLINTEDGSKGDVLATRQITEMPLNGRDFSDLAFLVPGVAANADGAMGSGFAINGARADNTNFLIDGFGNQNPRGGAPQTRPNLDALEEFKMKTSGYSPEFGRLAGGVMNMVLKSGGNQFHGVLFEFLRNDKFDARNFFDAGKSKLRQNQFGATVSGPVVIPKVYNGRDRTFFLFSWESYRQTQGQTRLGVVPTAAQREGDFSGLALMKDPFATGTCGAAGGSACFPGNRIPLSRLSPQALAAQAFYPAPNRPGQLNNYLAYVTAPNSWDGYVVKIDERISSKDTLSGRLVRRANPATYPYGGGQGAPALGLFGFKVDNHSTLAGLTYTRMFSPTLINEARMGFDRTAEEDIGVHQGTDYAAQFGIPSTTTDAKLIGFPAFSISGMMPLGDPSNTPMRFALAHIQWGDTLTWVKGRHLFKFGGEIVRERHNEPYTINSRGTFNFTGNWTGQAYGDFLLGLLNSDSRLVGTADNYLRKTDYGFFAMDDWKISPRLTLNFGLRYEIPKPLTDKYGRMTNFIPGLNKLVIASDRTLQGSGAALNNPNAMVTASQLGLPEGLVYTNYKNVAPRFGFAWRPFGGNRMAVRGGYGIFYGSFIEQTIRNQLANAFPFVASQTINRNASDPSFLTLARPFPVAPNLNGDLSTLTLGAFDLHAPTPYMQSWNLTIERELGSSMALEIAYDGSKGTHLPMILNINTPYRLAQYAPNFPYPYPGIGTINYFSFQVNSTRNAGSISLRRRFVRGFFYTASYTFSKSIDEGSQITGSSAGGYSGLQDVRNLRADRGRSDFDTPHVFSMSFSWLAPVHRNVLLRGWQIAGTGRAYSGKPFTPTVNNVNLNLGQANRPDRIAKGTLPDPNANMWFDLSAFPQVPQGAFAFGSSGRSILDAPGRIELNSTLSRNFAVGEKSRLQFRWEIFNVTNHANLGVPVRTVNTSNAGTITTSGNGRLMQFGFRYSF